MKKYYYVMVFPGIEEKLMVSFKHGIVEAKEDQEAYDKGHKKYYDKWFKERQVKPLNDYIIDTEGPVINLMMERTTKYKHHGNS